MEDKNLVREMADLGLVHSFSEARRLIAVGAVQVNGKKILDIDKLVKTDDLIQVGKKRSAKVGHDFHQEEERGGS